MAVLKMMNYIVTVGKDMERREPSHTLGGNINNYSHCKKLYRISSKFLQEI
jgi:hypothetical protein